MAKLIIVEDDRDLADSLKRWLIHEQHTVDVANNGTELAFLKINDAEMIENVFRLGYKLNKKDKD